MSLIDRLREWRELEPIRLTPYRFCTWVILNGKRSPVTGTRIRFRDPRGKRREMTVTEVVARTHEGKRVFVRCEGYYPTDIVAL